MKPLLVTVALAGLGSAALGWWVIDNYSSEKQSRKILVEEAGNESEENADAPEPEPGPETKPKPQPKPETKPEPGPAANTVPPKPKEDIYSQGRKTFDGTGKYYMGREIAYVMGHQAIRWLERADREKEEAPSKAIAALNLKPTDVIADIGAGSGYYTFRLAPLVPKGKVIAVDIQPEMIEFLEKKEKTLGITNVEAHLGMVDDTKLKPESIDAALMVDAYHEFSHPREMMESLFKALKPGGRIVLLEYRAEDPTVPIKPLHKMTEAQSRKEMEVVGLKWESTDSKLLPWQHFMVFVKP